MVGVQHTDLLALLEFMYTGSLTMPQEDLSHFLMVAKMLQVRGLTK
jgi:hypothetical protein